MLLVLIANQWLHSEKIFFETTAHCHSIIISSWCNIMFSSHKASNNLWPISVCMPLIHCRFHRFYGELLLHRCIIFIATILMFKTSTIDRCCILSFINYLFMSFVAFSRCNCPPLFLTCMCRGSPSTIFIFLADLVKTFKLLSSADQDSC